MKSLTRVRNCNNPSLFDLALYNNDAMSVLSQLGKNDHSLIEMQDRYKCRLENLPL